MGGMRRLMRSVSGVTSGQLHPQSRTNGIQICRRSAPARPSKHSTISKAPASGAAGTRQRGYACKPFARVANQ